MADNTFFDNENTQFELSYEFLSLLKWLVENESDQMKKIITRAVRNGFKDERPKSKAVTAEFVQSSIVDFLELIDTLFLEISHEERIKKAIEYNLVPALDQIDTTACDKAIIQTTLDKVSSKIDDFPEKDPRDIFHAELIKRWKPQKNSQLN